VKKRYTFILIGIPIIILLGLFWVSHLIFVGFEYREDHNGVGWSKFASSIRKHIKNGPNKLIDLSHYEGKVWFDVIDTNNNTYQIWTTRSSYADARNMNSLKSQYLSVESINGQALECLNNFGEAVSVGISSLESPYMDEGLTSPNVVIDRHTTPLSAFGEQLPISYEINEGQILNAPEWLDFQTKRSGGCGCDCKEAVVLEPPTLVSCQLK